MGATMSGYVICSMLTYNGTTLLSLADSTTTLGLINTETNCTNDAGYLMFDPNPVPDYWRPATYVDGNSCRQICQKTRGCFYYALAITGAQFSENGGCMVTTQGSYYTTKGYGLPDANNTEGIFMPGGTDSFGCGRVCGLGAAAKSVTSKCDTLTDGCSPFAFCTDTTDQLGYNCSCKPGFADNSGGLGYNCTDIDECLTNPCFPGATCTNKIGTFSCSCPSGYSYNTTTWGVGPTGCIDNNECSSSSTNQCHANAICTNLPGSYNCTCKPGFAGNGTYCQDVNECLTNPCSPVATCTNTPGNFTCTCPAGYTGNGLGPSGCTDINECLANPCSPLATCTNTPGNFTCTCPAGYTGTGIGASGCADVNECTLNTARCSANATCTNTVGNYTCACNAGFFGDGYTCQAMCRAVPQCNVCGTGAQAKKCVTCASGYVLASGRCNCAKGWGRTPDKSACVQCGPNEVSPGGALASAATLCKPCKAPKVPNADKSKCV